MKDRQAKGERQTGSPWIEAKSPERSRAADCHILVVRSRRKQEEGAEAAGAEGGGRTASESWWKSPGLHPVRGRGVCAGRDRSWKRREEEEMVAVSILSLFLSLSLWEVGLKWRAHEKMGRGGTRVQDSK